MLKGLLITSDPSLARSFRRELDNCADCSISFDLQANFDEAIRAGGGPYQLVTVDLDGVVSPQEAVKLARSAWPIARVAVLSFWWSEQSDIARDRAEVVIHKPLRSAELRAFLRSPTGAPKAQEAAEQEEQSALAAAR
jgi:hypothetical protein